MPESTMTPTPPQAIRPAAWRYLAFLLVVGVCLAGARLAWKTHLELSCWGAEWPHLSACGAMTGATPHERWQARVQRLSKEPGETQTLIEALVFAQDDSLTTSEQRSAMLKEAVDRAPQNVDVLRIQANSAIGASDWPVALSALTRLALYHNDPAASQMVAGLISRAGEDVSLQGALITSIETNPAWLDPVVFAAPRAEVPMAALLPLVQSVMSSPGHRLSPRTGQFLIERLNAEGWWEASHEIWRHLWQRFIPFVFNGDFEQTFVRGGFDWEVGDRDNDHRSGAMVDRTYRQSQRHSMRVRFTGKPIHSPIVWQYLMLPPGHYRLRIKSQTGSLHSDNGLSWQLLCPEDDTVLASISPRGGTAQQWQEDGVDVLIPEACGQPARLVLVPAASYESRTGMRGEALFDDITLSRLPAETDTAKESLP
ncbi:hypothetical protein [Hydrogenophaga sp. 5NK40-0174]|uniref:hypothetical protein n=1 Tax=Hydrogenophaga sp. 5NK40-0174 TaxID=3127649 RepID=UPI003105A484